MSQSAFCHKQDSVMRDAAAFVDGERQMMHKSYNLYHRIVDNTIVDSSDWCQIQILVKNCDFCPS